MTRHRADTPQPIMLRISRAKTSMSPDTSYQIYNSEHNEWQYRILIFLFTIQYENDIKAKQNEKIEFRYYSKMSIDFLVGAARDVEKKTKDKTGQSSCATDITIFILPILPQNILNELSVVSRHLRRGHLPREAPGGGAEERKSEGREIMLPRKLCAPIKGKLPTEYYCQNG